MNEKTLAPLMTSDAEQRKRARQAPYERYALPPPVTQATLRGRSPKDYCVANALADEWERFAGTVAARIATEPEAVWQRRNRCGYVSRRPYRHGTEITKPDACLMCNYAGREGSGWMRDMTAAEVKQYLAATAAREAEARERDRKAALYERNVSRQKAGLEPFASVEAMLAWDKAAEERRAERVRKNEAEWRRQRQQLPSVTAPHPALTLEQEAGGTVKVKSNVKGAKR